MKKSIVISISACLLLMIFSLRVTLPLLIHFSVVSEDVIAQQEDGNPEKSPEKSIQETGTEAWLPDHFSLLSIIAGPGNSFGILRQPSLPDRYSSIPTPPPWTES